MKFKTIVSNWGQENGMRRTFVNGAIVEEFDEDLVGWFCWVYPSDDLNLDEWMEKNMTGAYDCTWRFNSGDPMYTVWIRKDEDATLFKLRWI